MSTDIDSDDTVRGTVLNFAETAGLVVSRLFVAGFVVGFVPGTAGTVVQTVVTGAIGVFAIAVITSAYVRLREPQRP